jgi:hypothetical protein
MKSVPNDMADSEVALFEALAITPHALCDFTPHRYFGLIGTPIIAPNGL